MSIKISQLPEYIGIPQPIGDIPISINGTTYRIKPSLLSSGTITLDSVLANGATTGRNISILGTISSLTSTNILSDTGNSATLLNPTLGQTNYYGNYGVYGSSIMTKIFGAGAPTGVASLTNRNTQTPTQIVLSRDQYDNLPLSTLILSNSSIPYIAFGYFEDNVTTLRAEFGGNGITHTFNLPNKGGGTYTLATMADVSSVGGGSASIKNIVLEKPNTSVSGTLNETVLSSFLIPINSFLPDDNFNIVNLMFEKIGAGLDTEYKIYLSTVPNTISGVMIARFAQPSQDNLFVNMSRQFSIYNGNLYGWNANDSAPTGSHGSPNPVSVIPFNVAQSYYFTVTVQTASTNETVILRSCQITN